jgi:hypothetical protein
MSEELEVYCKFDYCDFMEKMFKVSYKAVHNGLRQKYLDFKKFEEYLDSISVDKDDHESLFNMYQNDTRKDYLSKNLFKF